MQAKPPPDEAVDVGVLAPTTVVDSVMDGNEDGVASVADVPEVHCPFPQLFLIITVFGCVIPQIQNGIYYPPNLK